MSNIVRRVMKNMKDEWDDVLNTIYGSYIESINLLNDDRYTDKQLLRRLRKAKLPFIDDPNFLRKTAAAVGFDYDNDVVGKPLMVCHSKWNTIVVPYLMRDGDIIPIPIRRDATLQRTVTEAVKNETYELVDWNEGK